MHQVGTAAARKGSHADPVPSTSRKWKVTSRTDEGPLLVSAPMPPEKGDAPLSGYRADARRKGGRSKMTRLDGTTDETIKVTSTQLHIKLTTQYTVSQSGRHLQSG